VVLAMAPTADAAYHFMHIREVKPTTTWTAAPATDSQDEFVELQMWTGGQTLVQGHAIWTFNNTGAVLGRYEMEANVAVGTDQAKILIGGSDVAQAPDFIWDDNVSINNSLATNTSGGATVNPGGAVCFAENVTTFQAIDCVAWGNFTGTDEMMPASLPAAVGTPVAPLGIPLGQSIERKITASCATRLDPADDTNQSVNDFVVQAAPNPENNADEITETGCSTPPTTGGGGGGTTATTTGQRAAALKKCKKKRTAKARKKCKRKAKLLPL
jgi:hypothetical protein